MPKITDCNVPFLAYSFPLSLSFSPSSPKEHLSHLSFPLSYNINLQNTMNPSPIVQPKYKGSIWYATIYNVEIIYNFVYTPFTLALLACLFTVPKTLNINILSYENIQIMRSWSLKIHIQTHLTWTLFFQRKLHMSNHHVLITSKIIRRIFMI